MKNPLNNYKRLDKAITFWMVLFLPAVAIVTLLLPPESSLLLVVSPYIAWAIVLAWLLNTETNLLAPSKHHHNTDLLKRRTE